VYTADMRKGLLATLVIAALSGPAVGALREPGCQVKWADDGQVLFLAHSRDNIFQRLLVLPFRSRVPQRDLEVWTVDDTGRIESFVWSVVCPADVPWTERIIFGDVPGGCTQLLPSTGAPPPLEPGRLYGLTCSRGESTFVLTDGAIDVDTSR